METLPFISAIKERDKEFYELMKSLQELVYSDSALDVKTKLMISLAVDAAVGADKGVESISGALRSMGVTDEQVAEILRITYFTKANSTLATSMAAFKK